MTTMGTVSRTARHARIAEILERRAVRSQTELAEALAEEGIAVAVATLSRDLDELGAVKLRAADGGAGRYVIPEDGSRAPGIPGGTDRL
ncbi:arginine repressor, partial [Dietzia sp. DQ11-38-2]|nr:arginine repressor [Dietzia sp. DQ11-38-2]